jgi:DNA-directed RNA polymerase specialized sigma24 family protein
MSRNFFPEENLVDRLLLDDTEAFEELHHRYCISLYSYCLGKLNSPEDAKRIVREIFVALWENRHSLPVGFSVSLHLYTEVRKAVVKCINDKLNGDQDIPVIEEQIIPGFNVMHLKKARQPVKTDLGDRSNMQVALQHKPAREEHKLNYYLNSVVMKNVKYAFQKVMHLW